MKKTACFLFLTLILAAALCLSALADEGAWTCPSCGQKGNTGNFCPACGTAKPKEDWTCSACGQKGNTGNFCINCGASREGSSPRQETKQPAHTAQLSDTIVYREGVSTISWTVQGSRISCDVIMEAVNGNSKQHRWNLGSGTSSVKTSMLMPGKTYQITLVETDSSEILDEKTYTMPRASTFEDGRLKNTSVKVTIELRKLDAGKPRSEAKKVSSLSADKIINSIRNGGESYGFKYQMRMPTLAKPRSFYVTIYIESPDGFLEAEIWSDMEFKRVSGGYQTIWYYMLGDDYFENLYKITGDIPSGNYTVTMFWDGMYVNQSTFKVK